MILVQAISHPESSTASILSVALTLLFHSPNLALGCEGHCRDHCNENMSETITDAREGETALRKAQQLLLYATKHGIVTPMLTPT